MLELAQAVGAIVLGFAGLLWSADRFVAGSAAIAGNVGVSPLIIGLTIVAFGTSAPEILVSINAALSGAGDLAVGNALGSNLANVGLVLGVTALLRPIPINRYLVLHELPILLLVTALAGWALWDAHLSRLQSALLLALLPPVLWYLAHLKKRTSEPAEASNEVPDMTQKAAAGWFLAGLVLLIVSAKVLVWGATAVAHQFGVSPLVIGLTVVAIGTSLPELATSAVSALRGHHDIALGNIIGSNMFNLLAVMPIAGVIEPLILPDDVFGRDYLAMAGITLLLSASLAVVVLRSRKGGTHGLGRWYGGLFLSGYTFYYYTLFQTSGM